MRFFLQMMVITGAFIVFVPVLTKACSCAGSGQPCQTFWYTDAVFSGEVQEITDSSSKKMWSGVEVTFNRKRKVLIKVSEAFRGITGESVEIATGTGGGDCGYDFKLGESYLVYAYKDTKTGELTASICSRTQLLAKANEDLLYLRGLPAAPPGVTFYGIVMQSFARRSDGNYRRQEPLAGIDVTIEGETEKRELVTDEKGEYRLANMPEGEYQIYLKTPEKLGGSSKTQKFKAYSKGCVNSQFSLQIKTELSGKLLDENSKPAARIPISMIPVEQLNNSKHQDIIFNSTDDEGRFTFRWINDGDYYLGVRLSGISEKDFLYPQTFYPGTTQLAEAKPITIRQGQILENVDFKLPVKNRRRTIKGVVLYPDGTPVANASLSLNETQYFYSYYSFQIARTNADGTFSFDIVDGIKYMVGAMVQLPKLEQRHAKAVELPENGDVSNLKFIISEPGGH